MDEIKEYGQVKLDHNNNHKNIFLLSIIGEIEGHENVASGTKATKYEHILPMLAKIEDDQDIDGLLIILNTVGGDVECGLAIAEMIASLSKPTVSLVLGGSHSIGVPLAVSADYCANRNNGNTSGKNEWYVYRSAADLRIFQKNTGKNK